MQHACVLNGWVAKCKLETFVWGSAVHYYEIRGVTL
jgi:hypothetical protein